MSPAPPPPALASRLSGTASRRDNLCAHSSRRLGSGMRTDPATCGPALTGFCRGRPSTRHAPQFRLSQSHCVRFSLLRRQRESEPVALDLVGSGVVVTSGVTISGLATRRWRLVMWRFPLLGEGSSDAFDGNALGLVQGANYCLANGITPGQYIERLHRDPVQLLDLGTAEGHPQTLTAAIKAGLDRACADPAANTLARTLALLAAEPVPESIFSNPPVAVEHSDKDDPDNGLGGQDGLGHLAALADPLALDSAVRALSRHGLVSRGPGGLRMHQLVQEVARAVIGEPDIRLRHEAAVGLLIAAMRADDPALSPDVLTPHVAAVVHLADSASGDPLVTSYLSTWLGHQHYLYGDLAAATAYLQQATRIAAVHGLPPGVLSGILRETMKVRRAVGDIDGALAAADEWADAARSAGSGVDEFRARFAGVATLAYASRFRLAADEQSALAEQMEPAGLDVSEKIMALSVQAEIRRGLGDTEGSLDLVNRATWLARDQTTGLARADHLAALGAQASVLERDLGHLRSAMDRQREAVSATRELGLPLALARQLQALASRLVDCEDGEEATEVLAEVSEIAEALGQERDLKAGILENAGRVALAAGDYGSAARQLSEAIPLFEEKGEHYRGDLAAAWHNLATAQMQLSHFAMAASSYLEARNIEIAVFGDSHPDLIPTEYNLTVALHMSGARDAAAEAINRCLRIIRRGGQQARLWRSRVLQAAIAIDLADEP